MAPVRKAKRMIAQTVKWIGGTDGVLELIDQRRLPVELVKLQVRDVEQLHEAIRTLAVRGAPAIGVAAAYGPIIALQKRGAGEGLSAAVDRALQACDFLASSRPTAVNLFWALDRMRARAKDAGADAYATPRDLHEALLAEANAIYGEDVEMCRRIGENGEKFIEDGAGILTHCNAGALATAGQGTALSVLFEAHAKGKRFTVYADETRPLLQGARLTAWELQQAGIDVRVICDNMAGFMMKQGKIQAVITGADRIAANGDAANKIGTYSLAVLGRAHRIPFYVAAPTSTIDLETASGDGIAIEERPSCEVTHIGERLITPDGAPVGNPAFDITPAKYIHGIITEVGVLRPPFGDSIAKACGA